MHKQKSQCIYIYTKIQNNFTYTFQLGAVASGPLAGITIESWGRRLSMLVLTMPFLAGWLLIYFATNVPMILVGRFVTGTHFVNELIKL